MTIEIRQLLIKSSVLPEGGQEPTTCEHTEKQAEEILGYVLEDCRQMVKEILRKERER